MPFKNRVILGSLLMFLVLLFAICFAPLLMSDSVRLWLWWKARQQRLIIKVDRIDAPLLRPVTIRGLHVTSAANTSFHIDLNTTKATLDLNLRAILFRKREHALRSAILEGLRVELRRNNSAEPTMTEHGWATLEGLLPDNLNLAQLDVRVEDGPTVILLRNASLSASEIEAGNFTAAEFTIVSPWFRQTFSQLRGATNWQDNRLTLAALSLTHGLDVQSITADLSHLSRQRVALEFDLDAFGGKSRAIISNEWRTRPSSWNIVVTARDISLGQTSEAIGFTNRAEGSLRDGKFTFRGDTGDVTHATASIWIELAGLNWLDRKADTIMLGASLYDQGIDLQHLYMKQAKNEVTMHGDGALPSKISDWINADFRGDISASITDLGAFASLFGAGDRHFGGEIAVEGTLNAQERKIGGEISFSGNSLLVFGAPVDSFSAKFSLSGDELQIQKFDLQRADDFLRAEGKIDMAHDWQCHGTIALGLHNLPHYIFTSWSFTSLNARLALNGRAGSFDSFSLTQASIGAQFDGTIDFTDLKNIGVTLIPHDALFELRWLGASDCIAEALLVPAQETDQIWPRVETIDLQLDPAKGIQKVVLKTETGEDERVVCAGAGTHALQIAVASRHFYDFGRAALRSFRQGERRPLSFPLNRQ
jgi:hypothetical protein